jgi:SAM-dependent methyltransferase
MTATADRIGLPSDAELDELVRQKYPPPLGWAAQRSRQLGYSQPSDVYEALVKKLVFDGCAWLDVGGGRHIFPHNPSLAGTLVARCGVVVAVDPSENVLQNRHVHQRVQCTLEEYETDRRFDLATLRMVAEHLDDPPRVLRALDRLLRPGALAIVLTPNLWAPVTVAARLIPFPLHQPIKRLLWDTEESDTFPTRYRMNSRRTLRRLFSAHGFREVAFAYLDDLSTGRRFRSWNAIELGCWRVLRGLHLHYPENCLLGVYQR